MNSIAPQQTHIGTYRGVGLHIGKNDGSWSTTITYRGMGLRIESDDTERVTIGTLLDRRGNTVANIRVKASEADSPSRKAAVVAELRNQANQFIAKDAQRVGAANEVRARDLAQSRALGEFVAKHPEMKIACPHCRAVPLQRCRTRSGHDVVGDTHAARKKATRAH